MISILDCLPLTTRGHGEPFIRTGNGRWENIAQRDPEIVILLRDGFKFTSNFSTTTVTHHETNASGDRIASFVVAIESKSDFETLYGCENVRTSKGYDVYGKESKSLKGIWVRRS